MDDIYQGLVPASVPYFVLDRHYSYVAASGLALAATLGSAVPQPFLGIVVDRGRADWMAGAGVTVAGVGLGLSGIAPSYPLVWLLLLLSGFGIAMFHPAAGKAARAAAGDSAAAMGIFASGGAVGVALAPVLATPALVRGGVHATTLFIPPAVVVGIVLLRARRRPGPHPAVAAVAAGSDRWRPFLLLTAVEVVRSLTFLGIMTFIELYWIHRLHASHAIAGLALAAFLVGGVGGTLVGGRLADRFGLVRTLQTGTIAAVPALVGLRLCPGAGAALVVAFIAGAALDLPFAVLVKLGQDYLPTRPGTAAGVTFGLAVSAGGLFAPVFGWIAETYGIQAVFTVLCFTPIPALLLAALLPSPQGE